MLYDQFGNQQKQQDIAAQLRECHQQLAIWNKELADIEQRLTVFRECQQIFQTQLEICHRERDYLFELKKDEERKQQEWWQSYRHDGNS